MAKKKNEAKPESGSAPAPDTKKWKQSPQIVNFRGSLEYKAWLDEFAGDQRLTVTSLIDQALSELARQRGFRVPPKR